MAERNDSRKRRLIQLYSALLYNARLKGFIDGKLYTGPLKNICAPGLNCYSCPGAVGACPLGAIQNALAGHSIPYYALGILLLFGLIFGRRICGWLCPVGLLQELLHKIPTPKLKKSRITRVLSYIKYIILTLFVLVLPLIKLAPAFCKYICPAGTLAGSILLLNPNNAVKRSLLGTMFSGKLVILGLILIASVFVYRVFCRFLCPLGALYGLFAKCSLFGIEVDEDKCTHCGACIRSCPMDIKQVGDRECIQCGECRCVCKENAVCFTPKTVKKKRKHSYAQGVWLGIILIIIICIVNLPIKSPAKFEIGTECPQFELIINGNDQDIFTSDDAKGKVTVVNLWASWCLPCVEEMPLLEKLYEENDINLIAVHCGKADEKAELIMETYSFPFAVDEDGSIARLFGDEQLLPQTIVIDADGIVLENHIGRIDEGFADETELPKEKRKYTILVVDQDGNGVGGVLLSVCDEETCRILTTDTDGKAAFEGEKGIYDVQLIRLPEGAGSAVTEAVMDSAELILTINK